MTHSESNWPPKYFFAAAIRPEAAERYPTLKPGLYYPVELEHPSLPNAPGPDFYLAPKSDPKTWVLVRRRDADLRELVPGDAWEGERIRAMRPPDDPIE